jgi:hypothetical protein
MAIPGTYTIMLLDDENNEYRCQLVRIESVNGHAKFIPYMGADSFRSLAEIIIKFEPHIIAEFYAVYVQNHFMDENFKCPMLLYVLLRHIALEQLTIDIF